MPEPGTNGSAPPQAAAEAEVRFTLDMIPTLAWLVEEDGFSFVNRLWRDYTGLSSEQAQGSGCFTVIHPDDLERVQKLSEEIRRSKVPATVEYRLRRHDGVYRWFMSHATPSLDEQGNVRKWFGTLTDIEDRKLAESRLKESEEYHRLIVNSIPGFISVWSPEGKMELANQRIKDFLGVEDVPENYSSTMHEEDRERVLSAWMRTAATGEPFDVETRTRGADGKYRWFHARALPLRDSTGRIVRWYHLATDIDDLKKAEEGLRRKGALLEHAERLTLTASFEWNATTNEFVWSRENYQMLEVDESLKPSIDLIISRIHPEDLPRWREVVERARRTGQDVDLEHRLLMPGGRVKHVRVVARAATTPRAPGDLKYVCAVMDITERKKAAEALRTSEHLARGQVETLTQTLSSLAQESKPEKFLEMVLKTISSQLGAYSIGAYDLDASTRVYPVANCEAGTLHLIASDEAAAYPRLLLSSEEHPVWTPFLETGTHCVVCDIREEPIRVQFAESAGSPWQVWNWVDSERWATLKRQNAQGSVQILVVPMFIAGKVTGCLCIRFKEMRPFRTEEIALTRALAHQATLALQLIRLSRQSRLTAIEAERNRMARDIHDTLAQGFTGVILQLETARGTLEEGDLPGTRERIERAGNLAREALGEARRSVLALRPPSLGDTSLQSALQDLLSRMTSGTTLFAEVHLVGEEPALPAEWKEGLLRVAQESLTNTIRHAGARSFRATMSFARGETRLDLWDDGSGFDPGLEHEGFGLMGMRERIDEMGGTFSVHSAPGRGTEIRIVLAGAPEGASGGRSGHA